MPLGGDLLRLQRVARLFLDAVRKATRYNLPRHLVATQIGKVAAQYRQGVSRSRVLSHMGDRILNKVGDSSTCSTSLEVTYDYSMQMT
jgi:hypothetical protein